MVDSHWLRISGASLLALAVASPAWAQDQSDGLIPQAAAAGDADTIIVTGTRKTGLRAADSPAPIEVVDAGALQRSGKPDVISGLAASVPSFTSQAFGGDMGNLKLSARLRGLSPNHALILVNGKRRHGTSSITVSATGGYGGAASADLSLIPAESIDHVEVLLDGAAAQYGTDAIAGVINIVLKNGYRGGSLSGTAGAYGKGDGVTYGGAANVGFGNDRAFINLTAEARHHGYSDRGGPDRRFYTAANLANPALPLIPGYPYTNKVYGDAKYDLLLLSYNAEAQLGDVATAYSFGSYGYRDGDSRQQYRFPGIAPSLWPQGFTPSIVAKEKDWSFTGGLRGDIGDWNWDLASTWGRNRIDIHVLNSANPSLIADTGTSPRDFYNGTFTATQWTNNLDIRRSFDIGLAAPVTFAIGGEYRRDIYQIEPGDAASRYKAGVQAFPGFNVTDAGRHSRHNVAAYVDIAASPVKRLQLDLAGRYEDYSDFGDTLIGKFTGRYDFSDGFAVRGTVSTGFRAPTLLEQYYSATVVSPTTASVRLPPDKAAAKLLGIEPLQAERSTNLSLGAVFRPAPALQITLDAYQIRIRDRIVATGSIYGLRNRLLLSQAVTDAIIANGNVLGTDSLTSTAITTAVNGATTRTRGLELVANYSSNLGDLGTADWNLGLNYNKTQVLKVAAPSAIIAASGQTYLDLNAISFLETAAPRFKANFGVLWKVDRWSFNLRETIYGKSSVLIDGGSTGDYRRNSIGTKGITDLEIGYNVTPAFTIAVGANNLFDVYPDKIDPVTYAAQIASGSPAVPETLSHGAFGINGGYYYARARLNF